MKILVIGGTGTVGSEVVEGLLRRRAEVRVMTRSQHGAASVPGKAEAVIGDLAVPETLRGAFEDVDGLFFLVPVSQNETTMGLAAVDAAKAARVERIVYM
jgi:uncharacterized protein YbjT (DUF2867 family)